MLSNSSYIQICFKCIVILFYSLHTNLVSLSIKSRYFKAFIQSYHNLLYQDWRWRDVGGPSEKYSALQIKYFETPPGERGKLINHILEGKKDIVQESTSQLRKSIIQRIKSYQLAQEIDNICQLLKSTIQLKKSTSQHDNVTS